MDDRDLMGIRADTDFTYDPVGRIRQTNEPSAMHRRPAPCVLLGRTLAGHIIRFSPAVPDALARELEGIVDRELPGDDLSAPLDALRAALARHTAIFEERSGPAYRFPASIAAQPAVVRITDANRELVRASFPWLYDEHADWAPCFAIAHDGAAAAVCFSSRIGAVAAEAGVDTMPAFRARGFASAVVAAWGSAVRDAGRIPLYSTSWDNRASQGVARRLGLIMFGVDATWTWQTPSES